MRPLRSADDCAARIEEMYGAPLDDAFALLHVTAIWSGRSGRHATLRIGPDTPKSSRDRFALGLARARADAILTTGKILREEPGLRHRYLDDPEAEAALAGWRHEALGRAGRPHSVLLTSGRDVDFAHPFFHDDAPVIVFTAEGAAARLRRQAPAGVRVVGDPNPSPLGALHFLKGEGFRVSIEAGARTTGALYEGNPSVDELMLSEFLGDEIPEAVAGPRLAAIERLDAAFRRVCKSEWVEPSGPWRFTRFRRRAVAGGESAA